MGGFTTVVGAAVAKPTEQSPFKEIIAKDVTGFTKLSFGEVLTALIPYPALNLYMDSFNVDPIWASNVLFQMHDYDKYYSAKILLDAHSIITNKAIEALFKAYDASSLKTINILFDAHTTLALKTGNMILDAYDASAYKAASIISDAYRISANKVAQIMFSTYDANSDRAASALIVQHWYDLPTANNLLGTMYSLDSAKTYSFCYLSDRKLSYSPYILLSTGYIYTASATPVDDPYSYLSVNLPADSNVIVIYISSNRWRLSQTIYGRYALINVDGVDKPESFAAQAPYDIGYPVTVPCIWAGNLKAGVHTFVGRFYTRLLLSEIHDRGICVIAAPTTLSTMAYRMGTGFVYTTSGSFVTDTYSYISLSLPYTSAVIAIYNASIREGYSEYYSGKYSVINVDGVDMIESLTGQGPGSINRMNNVFVIWAGLLGPGTHTFVGRFAAVTSGYIVGVTDRQIVALALPPTYIYYKLGGWRASTGFVSTTLDTFTADSYSTLSVPEWIISGRGIIIYNTHIRAGYSEYYSGKYIRDPRVPDVWFAQSSCFINYPIRVPLLSYLPSLPGSFTGEFRAVLSGYIVGITDRQLVCIRIPPA